MKNQLIILTAGIIALMSGCAAPIAPATGFQQSVGPDPSVARTASAEGILKVYSAFVVRRDVGSEEYAYDRHTDYDIYDSSGRELQRVYNIGQENFKATPKAVQLKPGAYKIKAWAAMGTGVYITVPVVIEAGKTTEVHLGGTWRPPANTPGQDLVVAPAGFPVGWRASNLPNG
jgi:hypothetical protein